VLSCLTNVEERGQRREDRGEERGERNWPSLPILAILAILAILPMPIKRILATDPLLQGAEVEISSNLDPEGHLLEGLPHSLQPEDPAGFAANPEGDYPVAGFNPLFDTLPATCEMVTTRASPRKAPGPAPEEGTGEVPPQKSPAKGKGKGKGASSANPHKGKGSPPRQGRRSSKRGNGRNGGEKANKKKDGEFESWLQCVTPQYIETTNHGSNV
jgi:hypothetical protein